MAITLPEGIDVQAPAALELKTVQPDIAGRDGISLVTRYEGLRVYVQDTGITYQLKNGIENVNWTTTEADYVAVGTNEEYLTLEEALAAGKRHILLKSDVVLASSINIGNDVAYITGKAESPRPSITTSTAIFTHGNFKFENINLITGITPAFSASTTTALFNNCDYESNATSATTADLKYIDSTINLNTALLSEQTATFYDCNIILDINAVISGKYYACDFTGANPTLSSTVPSTLTNTKIAGTVLIQGTYHKLIGNHITGLITLDTGAAFLTIIGNTCKAGLTDNSGTITNEILGNLE